MEDLTNEQKEKNKLAMRLASGFHSGSQLPREAHDFYVSDPNNLRRFIIASHTTGAGEIFEANAFWEPFCGTGELSEVLRVMGKSVYSTDLYNRGYKYQDDTFDFFKSERRFNGNILSNPPFSKAEQSVSHSLELIWDGMFVIMFMRIQFLEGISRYENLFKHGCLKYVFVFSSRALTVRNGEFETYKKTAPTQCYAWFVFQKGYNGEAMLRWIP